MKYSRDYLRAITEGLNDVQDMLSDLDQDGVVVVSIDGNDYPLGSGNDIRESFITALEELRGGYVETLREEDGA